MKKIGNFEENNLMCDTSRAYPMPNTDQITQIATDVTPISEWPSNISTMEEYNKIGNGFIGYITIGFKLLLYVHIQCFNLKVKNSFSMNLFFYQILKFTTPL